MYTVSQEELMALMNIDIFPQSHKLVPVEVPASQNPARVYLASLANGSHRAMISGLDLVAQVLTIGICTHWNLPWWDLRYAHTNAVRAWLMQNRAPATGNKILSAVRQTIKTAWTMNMISTDDYMKAINVPTIRGDRPDAAAGRALTAGEFNALLQACVADASPAGPRDASILGMGMLAGLRRAEIAGLQLDQYDEIDRILWVHGKRQRVRDVPVAPGLAGALDDWLYERGREPGFLFQRIRKGGTIIQAGISEAAVYRMLQKRAAQAGVREFTPHDLRRTFAGDALDAGADLSTVQKLMGHASASTTAGYDRRGQRAKRAAVNALHMSWEKRHGSESAGRGRLTG